MSSEKIQFTRPEQLGTVLRLMNDEYEIHRPGERLTDSFLDTIIEYNYKVFFPPKLKLYDSNEKNNPVLFSFNETSMTVEYDGKKKSYDVTFNEFSNAFLNTIRKYSLYYAAPCNYPAFFEDSYDNMTRKMERYREDERKILDKLKKLP